MSKTPDNRRSDSDVWGSPEPGAAAYKENVLEASHPRHVPLVAILGGQEWSRSISKGASLDRSRSCSHAHPWCDPRCLLEHRGLEGTIGDLTFRHWSNSEAIRFHQGSLGQAWLQPTVLGTNLPLRHLQRLPPQGSPHPPVAEAHRGWCVGLKKEIVEALEGRVKGPTVEELDELITQSLAGKNDESSDESRSSAHDREPISAPFEPSGQVAISTSPDPDLSVNALTAAQREEWKAHILRGHLPVKNPQAYTLSVDLFGPMSGLEKGRDEQSVSGNPHLKFGLVGAFRLPRSAVDSLSATLTQAPAVLTGEEEGFDKGLDHAEDELAEYEPSLPPGDEEDPEPFPELLDGSLVKAIDAPGNYSEDQRPNPIEPEETQEEEAWDECIKDMSSGVELVSLRYVVGLKSKSGPDVTAGLQKLILNISRLFPVKVLHCDPGTEFGSDKLSSWLAQQGVRMQTTVPTDKQANGVAERTVGWMKARARTLLSATSTSPALWPLAMRYAAEAHNRQVLRQPPLPAFGQSVLHKLKRPSGANKELMVRWITATYAAPHLTIPDGHVLISSEGNLVENLARLSLPDSHVGLYRSLQ